MRRLPRAVIAVNFAAAATLGAISTAYIAAEGPLPSIGDRSSLAVRTWPDGHPSGPHSTQILQSGALVALDDRHATVVSYDGYRQTYAIGTQTVLADESGATPRVEGSVFEGDWVIIQAIRLTGDDMALSLTRESGPGPLPIPPPSNS